MRQNKKQSKCKEMSSMKTNGKYRTQHLLRLSCLKLIHVLPLIILGSTIIAGCGYTYKDALTENTPRAYMKILGDRNYSKDHEAARQRLRELFLQANIKKIGVCYLSFEDKDSKLTIPDTDSIQPPDLMSGDDILTSYDGKSFWNRMVILVARELLKKGYESQFLSEIRTEYNVVDTQLHSLTQQNFANFEAAIVLPEEMVHNEGIENRFIPKRYLAVESFLKSRSWPDLDAILLISIPEVRHAVNFTDYNFETKKGARLTDIVTGLRITYQLYDVASKRQAFAGSLFCSRSCEYTSGIPVDSVETVTLTEDGIILNSKHGKLNLLDHAVYVIQFTETTDSFLTKSINSLFEDLPSTTFE